MKHMLAILVILALGCTGRQNSESAPIQPADSSVAQSGTIQRDSIISRRFIHKDLSHQYDYVIDFKKIANLDGGNDSCIVQVRVFDKKTQLQIDSLGLSSIYYYGNVFQDHKNAWSFVTGKNKHNKDVNNYDGDFCVADFNFDSMEDIAIVNDCSNSGQLYSFYIQEEGGKFRLNRFLTDSMQYFPAKINSNNKTLVTYIFGGVCWIGEHKYQFDKKRNQWRQISHRSKNICEEN
jgi:hypothetical protein